jgi:hypothetical protein
MADNCGMARLWAGIHYRSDHQGGVALGRAVARLVIEQLERSCATVNPGDAVLAPPTRDELKRRADALRKCCSRPAPGAAGGPSPATSGTPGSSAEGRARARGPQEGSAGGTSAELIKERARGPQEGT